VTALYSTIIVYSTDEHASTQSHDAFMSYASAMCLAFLMRCCVGLVVF